MSKKPPSHLKLAFNSFGNYLFLAASTAFTIWQWPQFGWVPLAALGAAEAFWLTIGSRLGGPGAYFKFLRGEHQKQLAAGDQRAVLRALNEVDRTRYAELERYAKEIRRQVENNPSLTAELLAKELSKIDGLLDTFVRLAATSARYEHYVETSDLNQIEAGVRRQEKILERASGADREIAQKNLKVLEQRLERALQVRGQIRTARGQLNLIDNTFRLLREQILTMDSPKQLASQLDELTSAVDNIETAEKETEAMVRRLDQEIASLR